MVPVEAPLASHSSASGSLLFLIQGLNRTECLVLPIESRWGVGRGRVYKPFVGYIGTRSENNSNSNYNDS